MISNFRICSRISIFQKIFQISKLFTYFKIVTVFQKTKMKKIENEKADKRKHGEKKSFWKVLEPSKTVGERHRKKSLYGSAHMLWVLLYCTFFARDSLGGVLQRAGVPAYGGDEARCGLQYGWNHGAPEGGKAT